VLSVLGFTSPYFPAQPFFTGAPSTNLVPDIFPIAINGREYMVDQKANTFTRGFEPRVRDSVDQSTTPGEAAINPQGLWRRGESSWHLGAGQKYADTADAQDYRFYTSQGINPWTKGQISLLNNVAESLDSANTNLNMAVTDTRVYVVDGQDLKYSTNPFAATPTWTTATGLPSGLTPRDITSDGKNVYLTYAGLTSTHGLWKYTSAGVASNVAYGHEFGYIDFVKGYFIVTGYGANGGDLYYSPTGNVGADDYEHPIAGWQWIGSASGPNAIYVAGYLGERGAVFKITISTAGVLQTPVVALDLPSGEIPTHLGSYLNGVLIGTNKGVRYATADNNGDLTVGPFIATGANVNEFTAESNFVWFAWSNFASGYSGLGRMDLSTFVSPYLPAYASDLMAPVSGTVNSVVTFNSKRLFSVSGQGVYAETATFVETGYLDTGTYRWGIPDRKFVAKFDTRTTPLYGTVTPYISSDGGAFTAMTAHTVSQSTESVATGPQAKFIEAQFRLELDRGSTTTAPTVTRWMARAYASPARSQVFRVPILMHRRLIVKGIEYFFDVDDEMVRLRDLVTNPRVVNYQENTETFSVVVEDLEFQVIDGYEQNWNLEGTCTVTMRSVQD
jgi:hypothetical protein